jgi:hypothetical protein
MASLDSLPADQRAVLELVLQRGRTYDEIARMLSIDRAGVRQRALAGFDTLGPQTRLDSVRRALITDYLLGQLPQRISDETRDSLARSPAERAWARVLASELGPLARDPLPEIPVHQPGGAAAEPAPAAVASSSEEPAGGGRAEPARRSSRLGGALLLGLGALVVIAVVLVLLLTGGSKKKTEAARSPTTTTPKSSTSTTPAVHYIAQVNLKPPNGGKAKGVAQIVTVNNTLGVVIVGSGVPANSHNAYAVWLYNSATSNHLVGFVSPGVTSNGQLQTDGPLPTNASSYKQLLVTLETQSKPKSPGQIVLQGQLSIPAASSGSSSSSSSASSASK